MSFRVEQHQLNEAFSLLKEISELLNSKSRTKVKAKETSDKLSNKKKQKNMQVAKDNSIIITKQKIGNYPAYHVCSYNDLYNNKTMDQWIQETHAYNSIQNKWKVFPLKQGSYGYDNLCICIHDVFEYLSENSEYEYEIDIIADIIHEAWIKNYHYWRNNEPWKKNKKYIKPAKPLNDKHRNQCAKTKYQNLPDDEKEKDIIIATFIMDSLDKKFIL